MHASRWDLTPAEAVSLQRDLAREVRCQDELADVRTIAGVDVSTTRFGEIGDAAIVLLAWPDLAILEVAHARMRLPMPYIPGLLSFREAPLILDAYQRLSQQPDLLMVDGHGRAHPRRLGIASHLGLLLDKPTLGCGKTLLVGRHEPLDPERGSTAPLIHQHELVGYAVRTKTRVNPVFVSCGHRISPETAVRWVLDCARGYRLPEPTRQAHLASNALRISQTASEPPPGPAPER